MTTTTARARRSRKLAVWKFASCDGCQLSLLDCEDELLALAGAVEIAYFPEASSATVRGPYDLSLVEGSITTAARPRADPQRSAPQSTTAGDDRRLRDRRRHPGAAQLRRRRRVRLASSTRTPTTSTTLATSTPISAHVAGRLRAARLPDRQAPAARGDRARSSPGAGPSDRRSTSVCTECKRRGTVCVDGRARHALPGPGHPCRLRRDLPDATTAAATAASARRRRANARGADPRPSARARRCPRPAIDRLFHTFNASAEPFASAGAARWHD